ncbi:MAG: 1-pyrroline-5-carboxylate dehydrogenase, partial [Verrucomicrobiota bacterium]
MNSLDSVPPATTRPDSSREGSDLPQRAICLAEEWVKAAKAEEPAWFRAQTRVFSRLLHDPEGKRLTLRLADEMLRLPDSRRAGQRFRDLLRRHGLPVHRSALDRAAMWLASKAAWVLPELVMPLIRWRMRGESRRVILSGERTRFREYLGRSQGDGFTINVNRLGEAVLGEA